MPPRSAEPFGPGHRDYSPNPESSFWFFAQSPQVFEIASLLPSKEPHSPGKPRDNPEELTALLFCALGAFRSLRHLASFLRDPQIWARLRDVWIDRGIVLNEHAPCRKSVENAVKRVDSHIVPVADKFREMALAQAIRQGCFTGTASTMVSPPRSNIVVADGTVPKMRLRTNTFQRLKANPDPRDRNGRRISVPVAHKHTEGGGKEVYGEKFVLASVRPGRDDSDVNTRIILDVRHVARDSGGEAAVAVEALLDLRTACAQLHGVCYDGAFRGVHISALERAGVVVFAPLGDAKSGNPRSFEDPIDCYCDAGRHDLYTEGGCLCEKEILDTGKTNYRRLQRRNVAFVKNSDGYRCYLTVVLTCGREYRTRLDTTDKDAERNFNRAERLRPFPPGSPEYQATYPFRNDAESQNNNLDSTHYRGRMIADSTVGQLRVMLAHALARNILAEAVFNARESRQAP